MTTMTEPNYCITKTIVAERERMATLPRYLGKHYLEFEMSVYGFMDRFCKNYNGGLWNYYQLNNGGFFMCLSSDEKFNVVNANNWFESEMSAEAVSIGVNIYALNALLWSDNPDERIFELYENLKDYAAEGSSEAAQILKFID